MIRVTSHISINEREIEESFVRASGPGGQNVNKLATAVQLRFDVRHSPSLTAEVRARLERLGRRRGASGGRGRRTPRRPTRPTTGSKLRRLEGKKRRGGVKALRQGKPGEDA